MVINSRLITRPRIGIAHPEPSFRASLARALGSHQCRCWAPANAPEIDHALDLAVVPDADHASRIQQRWPRAALLSWGRPAPDAWSWDGWIGDKLGPVDVADLLLEMLDTGLIGRSHGPAPLSNKHNTNPQD